MVNFKLGNVMRRDDFSSCHAQCAERVSHRILGHGHGVALRARTLGGESEALMFDSLWRLKVISFSYARDEIKKYFLSENSNMYHLCNRPSRLHK